jgi:riboflavin transporter FmnP
MSTKAIAMTIVFAAITLVLNPAISGVGVPFPPIPTLIYNIWEVAIIAAFLLMGFKSGISVAILNSMFLFAVYPGPSSPSNSIFYLGTTVSVSSMMVGIYVSNRFTRKNNQEVRSFGVRKITLSTILAMLLRVVTMAPIMFAILHYGILVPKIPDSAIIAIVLPLQAIFNITIALYTIPVGFLLARVVSRNLKIGNEI